MGDAHLRGHINLVIAAVNILIDQSLIAQLPGSSSIPEHDHVLVEMFDHPTAIVWHDAGYGELSVSVWWMFDEGIYMRQLSAMPMPFAATKPLARREQYPKFVGATVSVWLERKNGLFFQGRPAALFDLYTRKDVLKEISKLPRQEPCGFEISGDYYL